MEITVKTYNNPKEFEKDQKRMAKQGWTVQNTTSHQPRRTVAGLLFVPFAVFRPPQPKIMVTYQRGQVQQQPPMPYPPQQQWQQPYYPPQQQQPMRPPYTPQRPPYQQQQPVPKPGTFKEAWARGTQERKDRFGF